MPGISLRPRFAVVALYVVPGICRVYLVKTELKLRDVAAAHRAASGMPPEFGALFQRWMRLALGSFAGVLAIF